MGLCLRFCSNHQTGLLTVETTKEENRNLEPHLRQIVREPIKVPQTVECEELVFYKGAWISPGDSIGKRMMDRRKKD